MDSGGHESNGWCHCKERKIHVTMEAEIRGRGLQAKEWPGLPGASKRQEGLCSRAFRGSMALLTP